MKKVEKEEEEDDGAEDGKSVLQRNIENWNGITWERARYGNSYKLSHSMRAMYERKTIGTTRYGNTAWNQHKYESCLFYH